MTWAELFERAATDELDADDVTAALERVRSDDGSDGGDGGA